MESSTVTYRLDVTDDDQDTVINLEEPTADTPLEGTKEPQEESNALTDLDPRLLPARPLADGTDADSSDTSWEKPTGGGSESGPCQGVEEEAGGNLTGGSSHTRADATAAGIPSAAHAPPFRVDTYGNG